MELEIIRLRDISQTQKDKYVFSHMRNLDLKNDKNVVGFLGGGGTGI
jgi:ABC-type transporter Mla maintaining outer membrane lipid asymmetry ATPase subunit MlaF